MRGLSSLLSKGPSGLSLTATPMACLSVAFSLATKKSTYWLWKPGWGMQAQQGAHVSPGRAHTAATWS